MNLLIILAVLLLIPTIVYGINKKFYASKFNPFSLSVISSVCVYLFILISVVYIEHKLDAELAAFDLNGDEIFTDNEITPEQEKAMYRVASDTGRTFAPITGGIFSVIYCFGVWLLFSFVSWKDKLSETKNA